MIGKIQIRRSITRIERIFHLKLQYLLLLPSIIVLIALVIFPTLYALDVSLHGIFLTRPALGRPFVGLLNYTYVMHDVRFWHSLSCTLYFVALSVGGTFLGGLGLALLFNRSIRGKSLFQTCVMIPMIMTPIIVAYGFRFMLNYNLGIINSFSESIGFSRYAFLGDPNLALNSIILVDIWQWMPFVFLVLLAALESLPREPFEAAKIDGASRWQVFRRVTWPMLKPAIIIVFLIRVMDAFREFDKVYAMTLGGPGISSETLALYTWRSGFSWFHTSEATVMGLIMLFIVIVFSWVFMKVAVKR